MTCLKRIIPCLLSLFLVLVLVGCGGDDAEKDEYTATMEADRYGNSAEIIIHLGEDGKVVSADWKEYANGILKDENYGRDLTPEQYAAAQAALTASRTYPDRLIETQDIDRVEAVSGATQSHTRFVTLYEEAMGN